MYTIKFLLINANTSDKNLVIVCEDGSVSSIYQSGKQMVCEMYHDRITPKIKFSTMFSTLDKGKKTVTKYDDADFTVQMINETMDSMFSSSEEHLRLVEYKSYDFEFDELMGGDTFKETIENFMITNYIWNK